MEVQAADGTRARFVASHVFKRQWLVIAVVAILVTVAVGALAAQRKHSYKATATVLIQPLPGNALSTDTANSANSSQATTVAVQTEASLVGSLAVTTKVNTALKTKLNASSTHVSANVPTNTELIQISYSAKTPKAAQSFAEAYAVAYLSYRSDLAAAAQKAQLANLTAQEHAAEKLLSQASTVANENHPPADADSKVAVYESRVSSIQEDIGTVQSVATKPGTVVSPARQPARPSGVGNALTVAAGAVLGLLLGLILAVWRERRDDRVRSADEPFIADVPVLAAVPVDRVRSTTSIGVKLDAAQDEAFRAARTGLLSGAPANSVIAVSALTSAEPSAGVAVHLARTLSAAGYRIVLVDAAIASQHVAPLMGIYDTVGLSDVLAADDIGDVELIEADGVRVLSAGHEPARARERYSGAALGDLLSKLREDSDYLLLSTDPVDTSDGLAVVLAAECVALVVTDRATTHEQVAEARTAIRRLGVEMLGLVVTRRRPRSFGRPKSIKSIKSPKAAEPAGVGESTDSTAPPDSTDSTDSPDSTGVSESTDSTASPDSTDWPDSTDSTDSTAVGESTDSTEPSDSTEPMEPIHAGPQGGADWLVGEFGDDFGDDFGETTLIARAVGGSDNSTADVRSAVSDQPTNGVSVTRAVAQRGSNAKRRPMPNLPGRRQPKWPS